MIDHVTIRVSDFIKSKGFYERALKPIGYELISELTVEGVQIAGFGKDKRPDFWLTTDKPKSSFAHVAFGVDERAAVDGFFDAAVAAGGKDNGRPGPRPHYHPDYYGAFVLDPDRNNIEAMCRKSLR